MTGSTMLTTSRDTPAAGGRSAVIVITILGFSSLCASLMQSLVIPIQNDLPALLNTSISNASWGVTATLLGAEPVLVASAAILLVGSLICALSDDRAPTLVGRVLQGVNAFRVCFVVGAAAAAFATLLALFARPRECRPSHDRKVLR